MAITNQLSEIAYAKINLALHVRARRPDGYHELDTIFAFLSDGDTLSAAHADRLSLTIGGRFADGLTTGPENLVLRAASLVQSHFQITQGATLHLDKRLPIAAGIGGGSADAAAAARLLNQFWDIGASKAELAELLTPLGADIPACVFGRLALGQGTGTDLTPISANPFAGCPILLVNPLRPVSTAAVFAAWDGQDNGPLIGRDAMEMVRSGRNDLQAAAINICAEIRSILASLDNFSPQLSRMSGSGATCFAVFATNHECDAAQNYFSTQFPEYWTMAGAIR